jgi:hypothetical protein
MNFIIVPNLFHEEPIFSSVMRKVGFDYVGRDRKSHKRKGKVTCHTFTLLSLDLISVNTADGLDSSSSMLQTSRFQTNLFTSSPYL